MRIKIVSDGTARGTQIIDADTNEVLRQARAAEWWFDPTQQEVAIARVTFFNVPVEVVAHIEPQPDIVTALQVIALAKAGVPLEQALGVPQAAKIRELLAQLTGPEAP